jgi:hypothetical protein
LVCPTAVESSDFLRVDALARVEAEFRFDGSPPARPDAGNLGAVERSPEMIFGDFDAVSN